MIILLLLTVALASSLKLLMPWDKECKHAGLINIESERWLRFIPPKNKLMKKFNVSIDAIGMEISQNMWDLKKISYCVTDIDGGARFILTTMRIPLVGERSYCAFQLDSNPFTEDDEGNTQVELGTIASDNLNCTVSNAVPPEGFQDAFTITIY